MNVAKPDLLTPSGLFLSTPLSQSMGTYLPATVAFRLLNFGRILLLTWFMSTQQFGLLAMILLVVNVLTPLCSLGLNEAIARYVPQYEHRGEMWAFAKRSIGLLLVVTGVSAALIFLLAPTLGEFFYAQVLADPELRAEFSSEAPELARLSGVVIVLLVVYFYLLSVVKGLRMFRALSWLELSHGLIFLAGSLIVIRTGHLSAFTLTGLYGLSLALPILYFCPRLLSVIKSWPGQAGLPAETGLAKKLLRFSIWTTLAGVTWQFLLYYPQWFLNKIHGHEAVAVFNAVRQIGQFVLIAAVAVSTVVMTTVTKTWESAGREQAERQLSLAFRGTGIGLFLLCAAIALLKDVIIHMFRPAYEPGAAVLPLHLLFFLFGAFLAFLPGHFHLREKTRHLLWPWATGVAANVLFAYWLAGPRLGGVRATAAWQAVGPWLGAVFSPGFCDPQGLNSAAWCGVFAMGTAMLLCVLLIRAECSRLDRGTYIVLVWSVVLVMKPWILASATGVLILVATRTDLIFSAQERRQVIGGVLGSLGHVPGLSALRRRDDGDGRSG